jgi:hypothetical protein
LPTQAAAAMNAPNAAAPVLAALRRHWQQHPQASDTSAGIARWWLVPPAREADVLAALQALQREGRAEPVPAVDGRVRWRWLGGLGG